MMKHDTRRPHFVLINFKVTKRERLEIQKRANLWTDGNVSALLRIVAIKSSKKPKR